MSYMDDILEVAAKKGEEIKRKILMLGAERERALGIIEKGMVSPPGLSDRITLPKPAKVAAVDGGSYPLSMLGFEMYFIKSYAVKLVYDGSIDEYRDGGEVRIVDVDILIPPSMSQDRITVYRQVTELRAMSSSIRSGFLTLADGSLESLISRPTHMKLKDLDREEDSLCGTVADIIKDKDREDVAISVKSFIEEELSEEPEKAKTFELAEKALRLKTLFDEIANGGSLVFITKTGRSNTLFNLPLPDQYVLTKLTVKEGYILENVAPDLNEALGNELPRMCGLRDKATKISFVSGYARLFPGAPALKIQLLSPISSEDTAIKKYEDLVLNLASLSSEDGYPFPLLLAHQRAHIKKKVTEMVIDALGLREELSGREEIDVL